MEDGMLISLMFVAGLAAADNPNALGVDWTKAQQEKAEAQKQKEKDDRGSKYLFIGTAVALVPGAVAFVTGLITLVSGGIAIYSLAHFVDLQSSS
ncbi:MAG: hypothetical protein WCH43_16545, partial [Verrucomicrobiota bacterium]